MPKKKYTINSIIKKQYFPYIILALFLFIFYFNISKIAIEDDVFFATALNKYGSYSAFLNYRYNAWTGRLVIESLITFFLNTNLIWWKFFNIFMVILLSFSMFKLTDFHKAELDDSKKHNWIINVFICFSFFSLYQSVYFQSISWVTGSFNYLWPTALFLFSLLPFKYTLFKEDYNKKFYGMYIVATFIACNSEQSAIICIIVALCINVYLYINEKKFHFELILHSLFMILCAIFSFTAPGNITRFTLERNYRFPDFDMIPLSGKLYRGLVLLINHLFDSSALLTLIFSVILFILILHKFKDKFTIFLGFIPMISIILYKTSYFNSLPTFTLHKQMSEVDNLYLSIKSFMPIGFFLGVILLMLYLVFIVFDEIKERLLGTGFFIASVCSTLTLSFSPTMYASGDRIFFITDILLILLSSMLIRKMFVYQIEKSKTFKVIFMIYITICLSNSICFLGIFPK